MGRVLIVFPTAWDDKHLRARRPAWLDGWDVEFAQPGDEECPSEFDIDGFIDAAIRTWRGRIDGVTSSSDYPGATVAAAIATALGLPASDPTTRMRCAHKYYSRIAQREAAPDATPRFALVGPGRTDVVATQIGYPCFVKPVRGAFSVFARQIDDEAELSALLRSAPVHEFLSDHLKIFNRLVRRYTNFEYDGSWFLAEELMSGQQVTVEGYVFAGDIRILGVVDSIMHPGTRSFARFDYPSALDPGVQQRMVDTATRVVAHSGLDNTMFNVEMFHESTRDRISVIEINPRMCGQFADLYEKVDGTNSYQIALALAVGRDPGFVHRRGEYAFAASVPLRIFEPSRVLHAPGADDIRAAESLFPGTRVWSECRTGQDLADFLSIEDGASARYGIVNIGGTDRTDVVARQQRIEDRLGFAFEPATTAD